MIKLVIKPIILTQSFNKEKDYPFLFGTNEIIHNIINSPEEIITVGKKFIFKTNINTIHIIDILSIIEREYNATLTSNSYLYFCGPEGMKLGENKTISTQLKDLINNTKDTVYPIQEIIGFQHIDKEEFIKVNLTLWK